MVTLENDGDGGGGKGGGEGGEGGSHARLERWKGEKQRERVSGAVFARSHVSPVGSVTLLSPDSF